MSKLNRIELLTYIKKDVYMMSNQKNIVNIIHTRSDQLSQNIEEYMFIIRSYLNEIIIFKCGYLSRILQQLTPDLKGNELTEYTNKLYKMDIDAINELVNIFMNGVESFVESEL